MTSSIISARAQGIDTGTMMSYVFNESYIKNILTVGDEIESLFIDFPIVFENDDFQVKIGNNSQAIGFPYVLPVNFI